jgi:hypothetical protein
VIVKTIDFWARFASNTVSPVGQPSDSSKPRTGVAEEGEGVVKS